MPTSSVGRIEYSQASRVLTTGHTPGADLRRTAFLTIFFVYTLARDAVMKTLLKISLLLLSAGGLLFGTTGCSHHSPYASASVGYQASSAPPSRVYYEGTYLHYRNDGYYRYHSGRWSRAAYVPVHVQRYHYARPTHRSYRHYSRPVHVQRDYSHRRTYTNGRPTGHSTRTRTYSRPPSHSTTHRSHDRTPTRTRTYTRPPAGRSTHGTPPRSSGPSHRTTRPPQRSGGSSGHGSPRRTYRY